MKRFDFFFLPFSMDMSVAISGLMVNLRALDLGASALLVGVLIGLFVGLPYVLLSLTAGRAAERLGPRLTMTLGSALFAVGILSYGLANTATALLIPAAFTGAGSALFWPAIQTCMRADTPAETRRRTGIFNVSWTIGIMLGGAIAGHLYRACGPHLAFYVSGSFVALLTVVVWVRARAVARMPEQEEDAVGGDGSDAAPAVARAFRLMAWVANFTLWFAGSAAGAVFPRLCRGLGYSDGAVGEMASAAWVGQVAMFALLSAGGWWHYRKLPLVLGLLGAAASAALLHGGSSAVLLSGSFLLLGASRGPSHVGSVHYSLHSGDRGANMGFHEAILGAGTVLGPVLGGLAADIAGVRAPFAMVGAVGMLGVAAILVMPTGARRAAA